MFHKEATVERGNQASNLGHFLETSRSIIRTTQNNNRKTQKEKESAVQDGHLTVVILQ